MADMYLRVEVSSRCGSFVTKLKKLKDNRDNRGKRHALVFILGGVALAIISGRSSVSGIHRYIVNKIAWLRDILLHPAADPVSRAQLPRILATVDWASLNEIIFAHFGVKIETKGQSWYALDGKTLRGIAGQQDRVLVAVSHRERQTVAQSAMQGPKESEIIAVREMLAETGLEKSKITLDALHLNPLTTQQINGSDGTFAIQLKANQPTLLAQMSQEAAAAAPVGTLKSIEKGHGRLEIRQATFFDVSHLDLDPRWRECGLNTLVVLSRRTTEMAKQKSSAEVSFYLSNATLQKDRLDTQQDLFIAIRGHWGVESANYIRDVTFNEDLVKTKDPCQGQVMASLRTLAASLFRQADLKNFQAAIDTFSDRPDLFLDFLKLYHLL